jgi:hypothetical protein
MAKPVRVQLRRTKGWRMPPNTVKVTRGKGRAGRFGNPFVVGQSLEGDCIESPSEAVTMFADMMKSAALRADFGYPTHQAIRAELRGKNLACWCKPGDPCHADVLLELANG